MAVRNGRRLVALTAALAVLAWFSVSRDASLLGKLVYDAAVQPPETADAPSRPPQRSLGGLVVSPTLSISGNLTAPSILTNPDSIGAAAAAAASASENSAAAAASDSENVGGAQERSHRTLSVVSYSVFGNDTRYLRPLLHNAAVLVPRHYPGWQMRVYHDSTVPHDVIARLRNFTHVRLVDVGDAVAVAGKEEPLLPSEWTEWLPGINPLTWRFLAASDPQVDRYVVRDADSLVGPREREAVSEWIESGRPFHVMHDHPRHYRWSGKNITMLAGMWGGRGGRLLGPKDVADLVREWYANRRRMWFNPKTGTFLTGDDQNFLDYRVWRIIKAMGPKGSMRHNSFDCEYNDGVAFPTAGTWDLGGYDFVGDIIPFEPDDEEGGYRVRSRNHKRSGACWMKWLLFLGTSGRKRYNRCLDRRASRGFRNATDIVKNPMPPPEGCIKEGMTVGADSGPQVSGVNKAHNTQRGGVKRVVTGSNTKMEVSPAGT
mmetsp:Transcript_29550/g.87531  ORF Transcript_29550/g.87531 Transcript_29550/m.87531 type:complete len:488 (-) Transcript_29550:53-1516(-)